MSAPAPADLQTTLRVLRERREDIAQRYRVHLIGIAGSLARGEARPDSDVDIVSDFLPECSLFKLGAVMAELEDVLGRPIDLLDRKGIKTFARASIERDLIEA